MIIIKYGCSIALLLRNETVKAADMGCMFDEPRFGGGASSDAYRGRAAKRILTGSSKDLDAKDMAGCTADICPNSRGCSGSQRIAFALILSSVSSLDVSYIGSSLDDDDELDDDELDDECEDEDELDDEWEELDEEECDDELDEDELDKDELDEDELDDDEDDGGLNGSHAQIAGWCLVQGCAK
jgi:hypothetical protein